MDLYVGTSTGALKGVHLKDSCIFNCNDLSGLFPKEQEITSLCWASIGDETELLSAQLNRQLKLFDTVSGSFTELFTAKGAQGKISGLGTIKGTDKIATGFESGFVKVWGLDGECKTEISAGTNLAKLRASPVKSNTVATGGKESPLKVWDYTKPEKPVFTAKNVRNDYLDLRVPVWVSDMRFLPDSDKIVTCTGHHQVRLYDPHSGSRRPVTQMEWLEQPFTAMAVCSNANQVVVGNSMGEMGLFDLRGKGSLVHVYKGFFAGSIRSIECHPTHPYVASCGVDRFVRVHHVETKEMLHKIYCKTALNCVLMRRDLSIIDRKLEPQQSTSSKSTTDSAENSMDPDRRSASGSEDEIWDGMGLVKEGKKKVRNIKRKEESVNGEEMLEKKRQKMEERRKRRSGAESDSSSEGTSGCIGKVVKKKVKRLIEKEGRKHGVVTVDGEVEKKRVKME